MRYSVCRDGMKSATIAAAVMTLLAGNARAQCVSEWVAGTADSDVAASIRWLHLWDPDANGPLSPLLVAAGDFAGANSAGTATANGIGAWDGTGWSAFDVGIDGPGYCLTTTSGNNHLYVAGANFTSAGGNPAKRVAQWDGTSWSSLESGSGSSPTLTLLNVTALNSTSVVVTGAFTAVDTVAARRVAAWNPTDGWTALGEGMSSTTSCAAVLQNGDLVVGGAALTTGDGAVTLNRIGRWDGTGWNAMGTGMNGLVRCLKVMPNGDLIAGGAFTTADGSTANRIARWDGSAWSAIGSGMNLDVYALAVTAAGELLAAGDFTTADGNPANRIAKWDGTSWSTFGTGLPAVVRAMEVLPSGDIAVGGDFLTAGGQPALHFAIYHVCPPCPADFNGDGFQTGDDFDEFIAAFESGDDAADFNGDTFVTGDDFDEFVAAFEVGC